MEGQEAFAAACTLDACTVALLAQVAGELPLGLHQHTHMLQGLT